MNHGAGLGPLEINLMRYNNSLLTETESTGRMIRRKGNVCVPMDKYDKVGINVNIYK